jgi:hypothetical protein
VGATGPERARIAPNDSKSFAPGNYATRPNCRDIFAADEVIVNTFSSVGLSAWGGFAIDRQRGESQYRPASVVTTEFYGRCYPASSTCSERGFEGPAAGRNSKRERPDACCCLGGFQLRLQLCRLGIVCAPPTERDGLCGELFAGGGGGVVAAGAVVSGRLWGLETCGNSAGVFGGRSRWRF